MNLNNFLFFLFLLTVASISSSRAQSHIASQQDGSWSDVSTWSPSEIPGSTDTVTIASGHTVTLDGNRTIARLIVETGGVLDGNSTDSLAITGDLVIEGDITGMKGVLFSGNGSLISGSGSIHSSSHIYNTGNKTIAAGSHLQLSGTLIYKGDDNITNNGTVEVAGGMKGSSINSLWTNESGSLLRITDSLFTDNGSLEASASNNGVEYSGESQPVKVPVTSYHDLNLSGNGTHQLTGNLDINGNLTIASDTLLAGDYNIIISGQWSNSGYFDPGTGEVTFDGANDQDIENNAGEIFHDLMIDKSGGRILLDDRLTVGQTLTLAGGRVITTDTVRLGLDDGNPGVLNYASGWIAGIFERWISTTGSEYYFPIGTEQNMHALMATFHTLPENGSAVVEFSQQAYDTTGFGALSENGYCMEPVGLNYSVHPETRVVSRDNASASWMLEGFHLNAIDDSAGRSSLQTFPLQFTLADTVSCDVEDVVPPVAHDTSFCGADSVTLHASGSTGNYYWYDSPGSSEIIATGDSLTTPLMNEKDTLQYYVSAYRKGTTTNSLSFDGTDDYAAIDQFYYEGSDYKAVTVETWIKTSDPGDQVIASFDRSEYWRLEIGGSGADPGKIGWDVNTNAGTEDFGGNQRIDSDQWYHIAAVFDHGQMTIYVNGVVDATQTVAGTSFGSASRRVGFLATGSEADAFDGSTGPNDFFRGQLDEFRVWDTVRTQAQIQNSMNTSLTGKEEHLAIYYDMQTGQGTGRIYDLTEHSADAFTRNMNTNSSGYWILDNRNGLASDDYDIQLDVNDYSSSSWSNQGPDIAGGNASQSARDTLTVVADSIPVHFLNANNIGCGSDSVILDATQQYNTYEWSDGSTNDSLIVRSSGDYWVEVSDDHCSARDTLSVSIISPIHTTDSSRCGPGRAGLEVSGGTGLYRWYDSYPGGNLLEEGSIYRTPELNDTTTYYVVSYDTTNTSSTYLDFDGSDDYVALDDYYQGTNYAEVTVEAWLKTSDEGDQIIASFDRNEYWRLEINGDGGAPGHIGWDVETDAGTIDFGSNAYIADGDWHHVAAVYDSGRVAIYIDGTLDNSTTQGTTFGSGLASYGFLGVGSEASVFDGDNRPENYFHGQLDEVRIWDHARSEQEIKSYMNQTLTGLEPGLRSYYPVDAASGSTTLSDHAGDRDGTLRNMDAGQVWQKGSLILSDLWCEGSPDSATAFINPIPEVNLGVDTCVSDSMLLDAGGDAGSTYLWQDGSTSRTFLADTTGTYYVSRNDGGPCSGTDSIYVQVVYQPTAHDTARCGPGEVTLRASGRSEDFSWYDSPVGGNLLDTGRFFMTDTLTSTTTFYVASFDTSGCSGDSLALDFDGTDDYVALDMSYSGEIQQVTVEAWVKTPHSGGGSASNWSFIDFDRSEYYNVYAHGDGRLSFSTTDRDRTTDDMYCSALVNDGQWHHVAAVYDGSDKILYVDGQEACRVTDAHGGKPLGTGDTRYGFIGDGSEAAVFNGSRNGNYYQGAVDELRIWNEARAAEDINNYKNRTLLGNETNLQAYYRMNGGEGVDTLKDHSGNQHHGVLQNMDPSTDWIPDGYVLTGTSCESTRDTALATINPVPQVDLGADTCASDSLILDAGTGMSWYEWQDGSTGQTYVADTTGSYWVEVNDGGPCYGSDTVGVHVLSTPSVSDTSRCGPGEIRLAVSDTSQDYRWYSAPTDGTLVGSGDTLTVDVSSSISYYPAAYLPDSSSYALQSDGADDYVAIENYHYQGSNYNELTVEAWVRTTDGSNQIIASYGRSEYWRLEINGAGGGTGRINWDVHTDAGTLDFPSNTRVDDGKWHHVAGVYDHGQVSIYIDGQLDNTTTQGTAIGSGATRYGFVGRNSEASGFDGSGSTASVNGQVSGLRIWSVARNQTQIQTYMDQRLTGNEPGLDICFRMDNGSGSTTLTDHAGNNNGILRNMDVDNAWTNDGPNIYCPSCESNRDTVHVSVHPLPAATIAPVPVLDSICEGDQTELMVEFTNGSYPFDLYYSDGTTADTIYQIYQDTTISPLMQPAWSDGVSDTTYYYLNRLVDSIGCVGENLGNTQVEIFKIPETKAVYYIPNGFDL